MGVGLKGCVTSVMPNILNAERLNQNVLNPER